MSRNAFVSDAGSGWAETIRTFTAVLADVPAWRRNDSTGQAVAACWTAARAYALDSFLGALGALLFAILSFLPEHRTSGSHLEIEPTYGIAADMLLVASIAASLFAAIAFHSAESSDIDSLLRGLEPDRRTTFKDSASARAFYRHPR